MPVLGFSLAALIGVSLGLLGGGGSILTVPILVYVLGFGAKQSIAMGLAVVGTTSLVGAFGHWRRGNLLLKEALLFGAVAMVGTFAGARLSAYVSGTTQLLLFAGVMLAAAFFMFRNSRRDAVAGRASSVEGPRQTSLLPMAAAALGVGGLTGIAGVGGGFLIVPALVLFAGLPMKKAVGTSLLVIALNSFVGFYGYLGQVSVPWGWLAGFTGVAVLGIVAGTWASHRVSQSALKRGFSGLLVVMGTFIVFKNRSALDITFTLPSQFASLHGWLFPLAGGALIGLSASLLLLFNGRIAGISGIVGGLLAPNRSELGWRAAFVAGLIGGGALLAWRLPASLGTPVMAGLALPVVSGVLVGFGTRLGNGCTSGHGVCGIARGSSRSLVATAVFMTAGIVAVYVIRHLMGGLS